MASNKKKNKGLSIAIIVLLVLVIFIWFLVTKDKIITNLQETRFFDRVFGTTPEFVENHPGNQKEQDIAKESTVVIKVETEKKSEQKSEKKDNSSSKNVTAPSEKTPEPEKKAEEKAAEKTVETAEKNTSKKTETITTEVAYTELQLCFVEIDAEGSVIRKTVKRTIPKNDSPLATSIKLLLEGPDFTKSTEKNCMTLIPNGTKLLSAKVQNGVAYLDFSENFEFNSYGVEGYNGQLMQIVYTATNFSTVKSVQFLIEGQKKEYLGSEGQWIGSPLSRGSF